MDDSNLPSDHLDKVSLSVMASIGSKAATVSDAREDPMVNQYILQGMTRANERALSRAQKVQVSQFVQIQASAPSSRVLVNGGINPLCLLHYL